jgi:hypothetical protein
MIKMTPTMSPIDIVDVRSIADLLVRAMQQPEAANERFAGSAVLHIKRYCGDIAR